MKFFLHINKKVQGKNSKEKSLPKSAQIFFCMAVCFRLSALLIIAIRISKLINDIPNVTI